VFDGMFIAENTTDDPKAFACVDDPSAPSREQASVTRDGVILALRWTVDRDRKLKLTTVVPRHAGAFRVDRIARRMVRSGAVAQRLSVERLESAGHEDPRDPRPLVRTHALGG